MNYFSLQLARRFPALKTASIGKGEERQLTVRKRCSPADICRIILLEHNGESAKYKVRISLRGYENASIADLRSW